MLPPLRLELDLPETIIQPPLPRRLLLPHPALHAYELIEQDHAHAALGTRILVRRITRQTPYHSDPVHYDFITTRLANEPNEPHWCHHAIAYISTQPSPYPHDLDATRPIPTICPNQEQEYEEAHRAPSASHRPSSSRVLF